MYKQSMIAILVVALVFSAAPTPAHAELVSITLALTAAFCTAVVAAETVKSEDDSETAFQTKALSAEQEANEDDVPSKLAVQ